MTIFQHFWRKNLLKPYGLRALSPSNCFIEPLFPLQKMTIVFILYLYPIVTHIHLDLCLQGVSFFLAICSHSEVLFPSQYYCILISYDSIKMIQFFWPIQSLFLSFLTAYYTPYCFISQYHHSTTLIPGKHSTWITTHLVWIPRSLHRFNEIIFINPHAFKLKPFSCSKHHMQNQLYD